MTDIAADTSTTATIAVGATASSAIDTPGDHDWYQVTLAAGQSITVTVTGAGDLDTFLNIYDPTGTTVLASNDDISDGVVTNSRITFTATAAGTYFIDVGGFQDQSSGNYDLFVEPLPAPVWSNDQIAYQLINGFWGGDVHHFNVTQGGTINVDISALTTAEQALARAALAEWSDIIGVTFKEVTSGAQITFNDNEDPSGPVAQTMSNWSNGIISSSTVQISKSWITNYGTSLDSYSFQTYIHEIGHALGLGHSGDYNLDATYGSDALFANDAWSTSVMSYFSQHDNSYFNAKGFSEDFAVTPMQADILAMQQLYGLSTATRGGDTTYGYHSNAGGVYDASAYPHAAYTIYDTGGTDTLDFSQSQYNQTLNLNPETFSNVNGDFGNISIARGVIIENAIGGSGDDTIIGNSANNILTGGAGIDTVSYETATAGVIVDLNSTTAQNTGGAGVDTLSGFEKVIGSNFNDVLIGSGTTWSLTGGGGDDLLVVPATVPATGFAAYGGDGNDTFDISSNSEIWIDGGAGFNTVDASNANQGLELTTGGRSGSSAVMLGNIQEIIGSNFADKLYAFYPGNVLIGGGGDDILMSMQGGAKLTGGAGNDTYNVFNSTDQITENAGEGIDTVVARNSYALSANVENLTLYEYVTSDPYAGAAVPGQISENWQATGNDLANVIIGNQGANILTGLGGADTLTGGAGADTFLDTEAGHNGDTITDFNVGDKLVFSDATLDSFTFSISGNTLTYTGGSLTLQNTPSRPLVATAAAGGGVQLSMPSYGPAHNDFNGDYRSDVLWWNDNGSITEWSGQAGGGFVGNPLNSSVWSGWHIAATGDFNGDGRSDILIQYSDGETSYWTAQFNGRFTSTSNFFYPGTSWHVVGTGDFNGDGRADLFWQNDDGSVTDWLSQANGSFAGNHLNLNPGTSWHVVGTGDFNKDGRDDILWQNDSGLITEWLGQADGTFAGHPLNVNPGTSWHVVGTGHFNADGRTDILLRNSDGTITDWIAQADGTFLDNHLNLNPGLSWHVAALGDFDGDGRQDIFWQNDSGLVTEWLAQSDGSFAGHPLNLNPGLTWHVQDPMH